MTFCLRRFKPEKDALERRSEIEMSCSMQVDVLLANRFWPEFPELKTLYKAGRFQRFLKRKRQQKKCYEVHENEVSYRNSERKDERREIQFKKKTID